MFNKLKRITNLIGTTFGAPQTNGEFLLRETTFGTIHLDTSAIRRIVERTKISGVHEIKNVSVDKPAGDSPLHISLNLTIDHDLSAPQIGENLRDKIKSELIETFGIFDATFDITVKKITGEIPDKRRRRVR